jgi:acyl carrier protein
MNVNISQELKLEIKTLIIESLNIPDVNPEDIQDDTSLFEDENLGLDSIDGLEIVMALQEKYGVRIDDQNQARFILKSINTIAEFIAKELKKKK